MTPESLSAEIFSGNGSTGIQLVLLYNTPYNLSTVAALCEENKATTIIELNYSELPFDLWYSYQRRKKMYFNRGAMKILRAKRTENF